MTTIEEIITQRRSITYFEKDVRIDRRTLDRLLTLASFAPSATNMQPWETYTIVTPKMKETFFDLCCQQTKIKEASALVVIAADVKAPEKNAHLVAEDMIRQGYLKMEQREKAIKGLIEGNYGEESERRLNYTKGSAFLFAMTLMLAAKGLGYETHSIGRFDEEQTKKLFKMPDHYSVCLVVAIGYLKPGVQVLPHAYRRPSSDFNQYF